MNRNLLWAYHLCGFAIAVVFFLSCNSGALAATETWHFAVSGDSRNCGDVVMPAIAAGAQAHRAEFYWHLGDFRAGFMVDEDIDGQVGNKITKQSYNQDAWDDFIQHQLKPFKNTPVFLGIGNHELINDPKGLFQKQQGDYISAFGNYLNRPEIRNQSKPPQAYYHWIRGGIDFINMDNASDEQFDSQQMQWFQTVLNKANNDKNITTIVVGMHKALPDSISYGHSMSESPKIVSIESGRKVYLDLWDAKKTYGKKVYILASHSHYYMENIFNTEYWGNTSSYWKGDILPGWIVGTAGAVRNQLPGEWRRAKRALQGVYGYLLATVNPDVGSGGNADGTIEFEFKLLNKSDVPAAVAKKFSRKLIDFCFDENMRKPN